MNLLSKSRVYLAGPIDACPELGRAWRKDITPFLEELGIVVFDPCNKPTHLLNESAECVAHRRKLKNEGKFDEAAALVKEIRHVDLRMVDICDFLIVHLNNDVRTCGTWEELFLGNRERKPVLIHIEQGKENIPDWLLGTLPHQFFFSSWRELKDYLTEFNHGQKILSPYEANRWLMFFK